MQNLMQLDHQRIFIIYYIPKYEELPQKIEF